MSDEVVKYRGFTIEKNWRIYIGRHVISSPYDNTIHGCKSVINELIEAMESNGFTCPPKPTVRKVQWLSLPVDRGLWDREATEKSILTVTVIKPHEICSWLANGVTIYYRIIEVSE